MPRAKPHNPATAFQAAVRDALEHLADDTWLGERSPLASVTFLGARLTTGADATARGRALRDLLHEAADSLWDGRPPPTRAALLSAVSETRRARGNSGDEYLYFVLELRFLRRYFPPADYPSVPADIPVYLDVSSTRFYAHLERAVARLAERLLETARPALRQRPPRRPATLIGREREVAATLEHLQQGHSVAVSGAGGVGKTALGSEIAARWPTRAVFWHTFALGLNDNIAALFFALGDFLGDVLAGVAPSMLRLQLLADTTALENLELLTGMLRLDLERAAAARPLLVFDETDLLQTSDRSARSVEHLQVLALLEALSAMTPVLLIGQRAYIDTPRHTALEALDERDAAALVAALGARLSAADTARMIAVTGGLPRLIELAAALILDGEEPDEMLRLPLRGDARPLFHRLWRRLDQKEKAAVGALSVFRRPVAAAAWPDSPAMPASLADRRLLVGPESGEWQLAPFIAALVYRELLPEQSETLHRQAGLLRATQGEYTAAAHHLVAAGDTAEAVALWFPRRETEIRQGQAGAALDVFGGLSARRLPPATGRKLKLIQNRLLLFHGESRQVIRNLEGFSWDIDDLETAEAATQLGDAHRLLGASEEAQTAYARSVATLGRVAAQLAANHLQRGRVYLQDADITAAQREVAAARQGAELLAGHIEFVAGHYDRAEAYLLRALDLAEATDDREAAARARYLLFWIAGQRGDMTAAEDYAAAAMGYYEQIGDRVTLEGLRAELAGAYLNVRQFERVIEPSEQALAFFEHIGHMLRIDVLNGNLAEAYLETGDIDRALDHAYRVLNGESPRFRPYALYTIGLAHQRQGRADFAFESFRQGIGIAHGNQDKFIEAYLHRNLGRLHAEQGQAAEAGEALATALALFREMGIAHEAAATEEEVGDTRYEFGVTSDE